MSERRRKGQEIWVFAEQRAGNLHEVGLELLGKGREMAGSCGGRVSALLLGREVGGLAATLFDHGAERVLVADGPELEPYRLMPYVSVLWGACRAGSPDVLLFGATAMGVELAPRLAARLGTGLSAHCIDLQLDEEGNLLQMVPGWGGGVVATIKCPDHTPQMATVMPGVMRRRPGAGCQGEVVRLETTGIDLSGPRVVEVVRSEPKGTPLEGADVVVAGGWGVGNPEGWRLVEVLAEALGGAVGATRPPVDEGWVQEDRMIGQSGKTVRPRLYVGLGISGMMHHLVGMDEAGFIVAINTDPRAAIFQVSDLAVVGDFREIVPALMGEIQRRRLGTS